MGRCKAMPKESTASDTRPTRNWDAGRNLARRSQEAAAGRGEQVLDRLGWWPNALALAGHLDLERLTGPVRKREACSVPCASEP